MAIKSSLEMQFFCLLGADVGHSIVLSGVDCHTRRHAHCVTRPRRPCSTSSSYALSPVKFGMLFLLGPVLLLPPPSRNEALLPWCSATIRRSPSGHRKGLTTLTVLTAWSIWRYRNSCVFDCENPSLSRLFSSIQEEARAWARAGSRGLGALIA